MRRAIALVASLAVTACESVPSLTFPDAAPDTDATVDDASGDAPVDAGAQDVPPIDASGVDAAFNTCEAGVVPPGGTVCCGNVVCSGNCPQNTCKACEQTCSPQLLCCGKGGNQVTCKFFSQGCP